MNSTWRKVRSPDGRRYVLRARPIGIPEIPQRQLFWMLGWLWHHAVAKAAWQVDVTEDVSILQALRERQWRPPGWSTTKLTSERTALQELDRLALMIESGAWPTPRR